MSEPNGRAIALREEIDSARREFELRAVDRTINFEREAGFAMQQLTASDYAMNIALMNRQSVINAVTNVAAIGISLNPARKQAYLVPRDNRICLDISYMGMLDLAIASGSIMWGQAELVHEQDGFALNGFDKPPTHTRNPFKTDRGPVVGAYVVVKTADGDYLTTTMTTDEINSVRDRSSAWKAWVEKKKKCPWVTDYGEMAKKTVIKRSSKLWPKRERLDTAIHHLNIDGEEGLAEPMVNDGDPIDQPKNLGMTPPRAKVIRAIAAAALQKFNEGDEWGAFEEYAQLDDNEEKLALWSILKPHSALRSAIKRLGAELRQREEALKAGNVIDNGDAGEPLKDAA